VTKKTKQLTTLKGLNVLARRAFIPVNTGVTGVEKNKTTYFPERVEFISPKGFHISKHWCNQ
jgi:hypothetical protein